MSRRTRGEADDTHDTLGGSGEEQQPVEAKAEEAPARRKFEDWAKERDEPLWKVRAMQALRNWAEGQEVTAEEFDAAATEVTSFKIG